MFLDVSALFGSALGLIGCGPMMTGLGGGTGAGGGEAGAAADFSTVALIGACVLFEGFAGSDLLTEGTAAGTGWGCTDGDPLASAFGGAAG